MGRQKKFRDSYARGGKLVAVDLDGDVDMNSHTFTERRFNPYGGQRHHGSRKKHKKQSGGKSKHYRDGAAGYEVGSWHKITIPYGKKSGKAFILRSIVSRCKVPFIPINFQFNGNAAEFYVEDPDAARHIKDVHRRVITPDGFKMHVLISRCAAPTISIDQETSEAIKTCMSSRYDTMTHTLDLSKFHVDTSLKNLGLYIPLHKTVFFNAVMKIVKEHIPQLETLNLADNKLYSLQPMNILVPVCKQLKTLSLRNNKIRSVAELNHLKGMDILDLVLDGNTLRDEFKDLSTYISAIRDKFPKLIRLDDQDLPAPIGFDLGPETFPPSKKSFFAAEDVKDLVIQFLDQYYTIYDSGNRTQLLEAYHDQANFSLCLSRHSSPKSNSGTLGSYISESRNLLRVTNNNERFKLLKQGKLNIVSTLSELPQTMHDPTSFSVDIFHISPGLMSFSVVGVFKEVGADINNATLKTFSRTFVVVAQGQGFVITNETLFIAHASQEQQAKAFQVPAPTPSPSPAPSTEEKSISEKQLLVLELSKQTGMISEFSTKCLEENDWDYQRALAVFLKFQSEGKIPPEAFATVPVQ
ncbi:nuclear RNA export factor 1-like isoform X2 [Stegodyphus dumicola]|nr:nuclear RNA export factor 1-like isoform X2 [Stegodyphus dumicola]